MNSMPVETTLNFFLHILVISMAGILKQTRVSARFVQTRLLAIILLPSLQVHVPASDMRLRTDSHFARFINFPVTVRKG
jgi:cell shape-determining protein MreD